MSRVDEQQQKQAAEAERLQKQQDRASRDATKSDESRRKFGELVKNNATQQARATDQKSQKDVERQQGEHLVGQHLGKAAEAGREARLARGGVVHHARLMEQAKSFDGTLQSQRAQTEAGQRTRVETREDGLSRARDAVDERVSDLDHKREARTERDKDAARGEARADARVNAAISGSARERGQGGSSSSDDPSARGQGIAEQARAGVAQAENAPAAHEVKQISEQILEALASEVYVGINERGLAEFRIELKEGVLEGATLRVESDGGRIRLQFDGLEGHAKNLVAASEGDLARRLKAKGLVLDTLVVA